MIKYYENTEGELFVDPIIANHVGLIELTEAQFNERVSILNAPVPIVYESASQRKIVDALKGMELWATFRPYIHADEDRYDAFYLSQEIRIDDQFILDAIADPEFALTAELAQDIIDAANL